MSENGEQKNPVLVVEWDAAAQQVRVTFDATQFKTWEFVLAVLEMAKLQAETNRRLVEVMNIQKQMADNARVAGILSRGKIA